MNIENLNIQEVERDAPERSNEPDDLRLRSLHLRNFRNYDQFRLDDVGTLTILVGPNAVGKTSVVEAIQMVTDLNSFRTSRYGQLVRWGSEQAVVDANLSGAGRNLDVRLQVSEGRRTYLLNGKTRQMRDLKGMLPAVTFCPDDLNLAKGSNAARRNAMDGLGSQLSKNFYSVKSDYNKLIRQKNKALKDDVPDAYLDSIDEILVRVGVQLMAHRMVILEKLRPAFTMRYRELTAGMEELDFAYVPSWEKRDVDTVLEEGERLDGMIIDNASFRKPLMKDMFARSLVENRAKERAYGKAVVGPHADKVYFLLDGRNQTHYSSQGQQRSIVLAFKLAEAQVILETLNQKPVLLLDDVMSELDERRRKYFMQFITDDIQTFVTTTNLDYFDTSIRSHADIVKLHGSEGGR